MYGVARTTARPASHGSELAGNLLRKIPGQDHDVIGLKAKQVLGRMYRDMAARQKAALLGRVRIKHSDYLARAHATIVQECVALGSGAISCNAPPVDSAPAR